MKFRLFPLLLIVTILINACAPSELRRTKIPPATEPPVTETSVPTVAPTPLASPTPILPSPGAPLCPSHDPTEWHSLWDGVRGCHYDHEHGQNPFTAQVANTFPDFDVLADIGGVGVGHQNPTSPMEFTMKGGGIKWDVTLSHSAGCTGGTNAPTGVDAFVVQYHNFGDYSVEMETMTHSAVGFLRQCQVGNPTDYGYMRVNTWQIYGQRISPYQGDVIPYPDTPMPAYNPGTAPYFSIDCIDPVDIRCRASRAFVLNRKANASSTWVSRPQAIQLGNTLFSILFRVRDNYQLILKVDTTYPFTFIWMCSADNGLTYAASAGCGYNNTTSRIHELHGTIPVSWDNLEGFDTDPRVGRITASGFVTSTGQLNLDCEEAGGNCFPLELIRAFVGPYTSAFALVSGKGSFSAENLPERDIYFCNGVLCSEATAGAVSSGWVGPGN